MKNAYVLLVVGALAASLTYSSRAHCQIPCGIYDDDVRISLLREHVITIEKSMKQIAELGSADKPAWNQLVRWVNNKDAHADALADIVTSYFMAQRIKVPDESADEAVRAAYTAQIGLLHRMLVHAMKAKQTTDTAHVETLRGLIDDFEALYTGKATAAQTHGEAPHTH